MSATDWAASGRDEAYTRLCEALTLVGRGQETAFLARLCLLLTEAVGDAERVERLIEEAIVAGAG